MRKGLQYHPAMVMDGDGGVRPAWTGRWRFSGGVCVLDGAVLPEARRLESAVSEPVRRGGSVRMDTVVRLR